MNTKDASLKITEEAFSCAPVPFLVVFQGRSGSTHFCSLLDSHTRVSCQLEVFSTVGQDGQTRLPQLETASQCMTRLFRIFSRNRKQARGFKIKPHQLKVYQEVQSFLLENSKAIRAIHLDRKSELQMALSSQIKNRLQQFGHRYNLQEGVEISDGCFPFEMDIEHAIHFVRSSVRRREQIESFVSKFDHRLDVFYEDLCAEQSGVLARVCKFLGVEPEPGMKSQFVKIVDRDYREYISNFDDLCRKVRGTEFADHLPEIATRASQQ